MRIYLDVDDTLAHFRAYAIANGVPEWSGSWYMTDRAGWTDEQKFIQDRTNDLMRDPGFWANIPPVERAADLIAAASFKGPVYLLTAVPAALAHEEHVVDMVRRAKTQWVWQTLHVPPERVIVCHRAEKVRYAFDHFERCANVLVDDAIQTCEAWHDAGGVAFHIERIEDGLDKAVDFVKSL